MLGTKRWTIAWLVFLALLAIWAATYYVAWQLGAPRWGLTAVACIGGPVSGFLAGRLASRNKNAGIEAG